MCQFRRDSGVENLRVVSVEESSAVLDIDRQGAGVAEVLPRLLDEALGIEDLSIQRPST